MTPVGEKKRLRAQMGRVRDALGAAGRAQADARIARQVGVHPAFACAELVLTYLSMGAEVDTRALIREAWLRGKTVAIPRVAPGTRQLEWYAIDGFEGLVRSGFGVEEPAPDPARLVSVPCGKAPAAPLHAVALVPGFTFDAEGFRVGYGGGFYDVFLSAFGGVSLGLCRAVQFSDVPLPRDEHDVPVDAVIVG